MMRLLALIHALVAYNGVLAAPRATVVEEGQLEDRQLLPDPVVKLSRPAATIQGRARPYVNIKPVTGGVLESFKQVPFATPPLGPLRLKPPVPLDPSSDMGTIDATTVAAAACPQQFMDINADIPGLPADVKSVLGTVIRPLLNYSAVGGSEDCLTLNVQRPGGTKAGDNLPVIMFVFGGGFEIGSTAMTDGTHVVEKAVELGKPIIYVNMNYRVAGFGFLGGREILADGSTNLGLQDQRLAMQWVQDHIRDFGGDPDKVTLWGQSAGSISIFDHLLINDGNNTGASGAPLFHAAIMDSGSAIPTDPVDSPKAQAIYDLVVANAGCAGQADTLNCLRGVPYDVFLNASNSVPSVFSYTALALSYLPRPDGKFLISSPESVVNGSNFARVPFILGDQEDEGTLFGLFTSNLSTTEQLTDYLRQNYFSDPAADIDTLISLYPDDPAAGSPFRTGTDNNWYPQFKRISALIGDIIFTLTRRVVLNVANARAPDLPTWSYLAVYDHDTPYVGTLHGSDIIEILFGTEDNYAAAAVLNYYLNFAYNLDPNNGTGGTAPMSFSGEVPTLIPWPRWSEGNTLVQFDADNFSYVQDDFRQPAYEFVRANAQTLHF